LTDGESCINDGDCNPYFRCNFAEILPVCRQLFSLPIGALSISAELCQSGSVAVDDTCVVPYVSKRLGQSCASDTDCPTTDVKGTNGKCTCVDWWFSRTQDCRVCDPVSGDYFNQGESLRNWLFVRAGFCGSVWTLDECLREKKDNLQVAYLEYMCESQQLRHGQVVTIQTAQSGGCVDDRFTDYCSNLAKAKSLLEPPTIAEAND